jgi:osmotically-inducible protein OsmY
MKRTINRTLCSLLAVSGLAAVLSACAPLIVGGAVVGGMVAADRRTTGSQVEDEGIELRATNRLRENLGSRVHVNVTSFNRQVLLTGEVPTGDDRQKVEMLVAGVDNVRSVVNDLAVMPNSTLSQRSNDTYITGKVRANLVDAQDLFATAYKVVTERGVVYLMGRVTQREADRATQIVRGVNGVAKVVRVFEIISEEELRRSTLVPAEAPRNSPAPVSSPTPVPAAAPQSGVVTTPVQ